MSILWKLNLEMAVGFLMAFEFDHSAAQIDCQQPATSALWDIKPWRRVLSFM